MRSRHTGRGRNLFCLPSNIFVAFVVIVVKLHTENQPVASHQNLFQGSNRKGIVSVVLAKPCEDVGLNVTVSNTSSHRKHTWSQVTLLRQSDLGLFASKLGNHQDASVCVVVYSVALLPSRKLGILNFCHIQSAKRGVHLDTSTYFSLQFSALSLTGMLTRKETETLLTRSQYTHPAVFPAPCWLLKPW